MKCVKNIALVILLCSISATHTKRIVFPIAEPKTFTELVNFVKTTPNVWNPATSTFSEQFIQAFKKGSQTANLAMPQFTMLLDMTSCRISFTGDIEKDKQITNNYMQQKGNITQEYAGYIIQGTKPIQEPSSGSDEEMKAFIQQLINQKDNTTNLNFFADPDYVWRQAYTGETFGNFTSKIKEQYPNPQDQAKAKRIFINTIAETYPNISREGERWGQMLQYINLNIPHEYKQPTEEIISSEEQQLQEQQ